MVAAGLVVPLRYRKEPSVNEENVLRVELGILRVKEVDVIEQMTPPSEVDEVVEIVLADIVIDQVTPFKYMRPPLDEVEDELITDPVRI